MSNCNKLRAIIQADLNSNKSWTANDRNDTKESDPMKFDHVSRGNGNGKSKDKIKGKDSRKGQSKSKGKGAKPDKNDKACCECGKK